MDPAGPVLTWEIEPIVDVAVEPPTPDYLYFEIVEVREDDLATLVSF